MQNNKMSVSRWSSKESENHDSRDVSLNLDSILLVLSFDVDVVETHEETFFLFYLCH
jgi:hypothetical protein